MRMDCFITLRVFPRSIIRHSIKKIMTCTTLILCTQVYADDFDRQICTKLNSPTEKYSCFTNLDGVDIKNCSVFKNQMHRFRCEQDIDIYNQIEDECRKDFKCFTENFYEEHGETLCHADEKRRQSKQIFVNPTFDMRRFFPDDNYNLYGWERPGAGIILLQGKETGRLYTYNPFDGLCNQAN